MEGAIKHTVWAASLTGCVYLATTSGWSPIQLNVAPQLAALSGPKAVVTDAPAGLSAAASEKQALSNEELLRAAQLLSAAKAGTDSGQVGLGKGGAEPAPAAGAAGGQSASFATIEDATIARKVTETLAKLEGVVDVPAGTPEGRVATIFFDPRCPYCHAAFKAMHGKVAARWVPVAVLGEAEVGAKMAAAILSAPDRVAALTTAFAGNGAPSGEVAPEMTTKVNENRDAFASIFAASPNLRPGVPTMFVPRPDGRLAIMVGYEAGDEAKMRSVMSGS